MAATSGSKPTPEQLLQQLETQEEHQSHGRLKVFFGYASGVGKSFRMLDEGRRRYERGQDVVVGAIQPRLSPDLQQIINTLEVIPLKEVQGVPVMDLETILRRQPKVCLVDGLAYDNPPGLKHERRWQDVAELLDSGISVITSVNLQHIEEMTPRVEAITGKHVTQTVPLSFLQTADEIVVVDVPPESCMTVSEDGNSTKPHKLSQHQLSELREIALLLAADVIDSQLERYLERHGIQQSWGTQERILVCLSPQSNAERMLESGARNRDRFHGELLAAHLNRPDWSPEQRKRVEEGVALARQRDAEIVELDGEDPVDTILRFARQRGITQIYVGHKGRESWWERAFGSDLDRLISSAEGMDVRVFPHS
ncbi:MAG: universal stress protein [Acidobacteriaceae bacterium]|nr:universal stress protein [Acidobacteriaceae bacterium]MBV9037965.1 universal stress protein [Acidobacteriaceae bacterium]MBV9223684.1 universal stress protein [Acidobacteriaceae bacterium]MBV9308158.1 universal stress protein [Acidobacteriaceae bacterium]MBV9679796.1 universal stress protein [Acidobacteriaceae bacterium]